LENILTADKERSEKADVDMSKESKNRFKNFAATGGIALFFIMAFEILIMISPFAFFFYSVFNPVFAWLDHYTATSWLTGFFLPHMILPPTLLLKTIRILGSLFFVVGAVSFVICAAQVYGGKIFKWGVATRGLYKYIRHPQYFSLALWGAGLCILWPRFIVLASFSIMLILYYLLARDEERRMTAQYGQSYSDYLRNTGMFLPRCIETLCAFILKFIPDGPIRFVIAPALIVIVVIGCGFALRAVTLHSLLLQSKGNLTLVSILPEDNHLDANILNGISQASAGLRSQNDYLGYVMPGDYVMQGMIADTGESFHLYKSHHSIAMIAEWVLHPFSHLRASPTLHMAKMHHVDPAFARRHHCPMGIDDPNLDCKTCPYRRVIIVQVERKNSTHLRPRQLFAFDATRVPIEALDIDTRTGHIVNVKKVKSSTAWKNVPTPVF
jgi:protein-S-isoprenylcysteine O-methyltransferase Ste14